MSDRLPRIADEPAAARLVPNAADIVVRQRPAGCPAQRAAVGGAAMAALRGRSPGAG